ncbi:hypothetical protein ABVK25_010819 [Lepraria finkii]|uniref:Protein kinase domain-containing protein n=1 Tax=Lepraria finkii TaxID=1340010 RepID=A0ABR4AVW6_9LECA
MTVADIEFIPHKYTEDDSFRCVGDPEPYVRRQDVIFYSQGSKWNIKVTFNSVGLKEFHENGSNGVCRFLSDPIKNKLKRRQEFQSFIRLINFEKLTLLDNTVTEIELMLKPAGTHASDVFSELLALDRIDSVARRNRFLDIAPRLKLTVREDPLRVLYPPYSHTYVHDPSWPTKWLSAIQAEEHIAGSAFRVVLAGEKIPYVFKKIDRPFYQPEDTAIIQQELQNLRLFRGAPNIVQLSGIVISPDPYQTTTGYYESVVVRGFLMEHHPGGTLEQWLGKADLAKFQWKRWPLQIGYGLLYLHQKSITHMDLKPSNVVIDIDSNALLVDVSGVGGVTYEWTAPELRDKNDLNVSLEERVLNDIWAYGMLLSAIAQSSNRTEDVALLHEVAQDTTKECPQMRIELTKAILKLEGFEFGDISCAKASSHYT